MNINLHVHNTLVISFPRVWINNMFVNFKVDEHMCFMLHVIHWFGYLLLHVKGECQSQLIIDLWVSMIYDECRKHWRKPMIFLAMSTMICFKCFKNFLLDTLTQSPNNLVDDNWNKTLIHHYGCLLTWNLNFAKC